jgi:hypothetical protein
MYIEANRRTCRYKTVKFKDGQNKRNKIADNPDTFTNKSGIYI